MGWARNGHAIGAIGLPTGQNPMLGQERGALDPIAQLGYISNILSHPLSLQRWLAGPR